MPDGSGQTCPCNCASTDEQGRRARVRWNRDGHHCQEESIEEIKALRDELQRENIVLREELGKTSMFEEVIGTSSALQMILARAAKVAPTDPPF